ncbi:MAG: hypothetical protein NC184_05320 [Roseburia sp.]|nr:hypothetical protein [Roseburia sp.]
MKGFFSFIIMVVLLGLIAGAVVVIYKYTNGFNEDFKTFYIEYDGEQILTGENKMTYENGTYRYDVKYTFDTDDAEPKDYTVKIVPNTDKDFEYTVDEKVYKYSKISDLSTAFNLTKQPTYFEFTVTENMNIQSVIATQYPGKTVEIDKSAMQNNPYPFKLVISSYSGSVTYNILFGIPGAKVTSVVFDKTSIVF